MTSSPTENELDRLLAAAAQDPAERPAFGRALVASDVYVLGRVEGDGDDGVAGAETSVHIVSIADDDGQIIPFFTSERALREFLAARPGTDPNFVRLSCQALFEMTRGSRLVLNPQSQFGKVFLPGEVSALVAGQEPGLQADELEAGRPVFVGEAAHIPPELPAVLSRFFVQRPVVIAAHLGRIAHPDGQSGYLLVVVTNEGDKAMEGFGSLGIGEFTNGETLDVMVARPGEDHFLTSVPPFYSRPPQADTPEPRKRRWRRS